MADISLMLARRGTLADLERLQSEGYLFDLKVDGVRCMARVDRGAVLLRSRSGEDITACYPEVTEQLGAQLPSGLWVLDGELAVSDERGRPSWPLTHKRAAQRSKYAQAAAALPVTFHVFDLLHAGLADISRQPFRERRELLDQQFPPGRIVTPVLHTRNGEALWKAVVEHQLEGVIAKRPAAAYKGGRSRDWLKIKRTSTVTCLVGGYEPGEGTRAATFGALYLFLLDDNRKLQPVGKVGSGFSDFELTQITAAMHDPPLIIEVEYLDVSPDGQLRQPVFQRIRKDAAIADCTTDQLT